MSHCYLIFSLDEEATGWRMEAAQLQAEYPKRWPDAEPYSEHPAPGEVEWKVRFPDGAWLRAHLPPGGDSFILRGFLERVADAACWYRSLVPPEQGLFLSDDVYHCAMLLMPDTTPAQILDHFLHGPTTTEIDPLTGAPYPGSEGQKAKKLTWPSFIARASLDLVCAWG